VEPYLHSPHVPMVTESYLLDAYNLIVSLEPVAFYLEDGSRIHIRDVSAGPADYTHLPFIRTVSVCPIFICVHRPETQLLATVC
jgi:hypothetical protein